MPQYSARRRSCARLAQRLYPLVHRRFRASDTRFAISSVTPSALSKASAALKLKRRRKAGSRQGRSVHPSQEDALVRDGSLLESTAYRAVGAFNLGVALELQRRFRAHALRLRHLIVPLSVLLVPGAQSRGGDLVPHDRDLRLGRVRIVGVLHRHHRPVKI